MPVISDTEAGYTFESDPNLVVTTMGVIASAYEGVFNSQHFSTNLINQGMIFGAGSGVASTWAMRIFNDPNGDIVGGAWGIRLVGGDGSRIVNQGTVSGDSAEGIHVEAADTSIQNSGSVSGQIGIYLNVEGGAGTVVNSGRITGDSIAVYKEGGGTLSFRNSGTIDGDVTFADGTNNFNGRGGSVSGTVMGGSGVDTIRAGDDGETIGGGAGHDRLFAGAGADTFVFASISAADSDYVRGFNVAEDTIQLARSTFTRLVVDATPTFSIATAATSPTDYLYYNSTTGGLYYDTDGNAASPGRLIASLGPGLSLKASNFQVV